MLFCAELRSAEASAVDPRSLPVQAGWGVPFLQWGGVPFPAAASRGAVGPGGASGGTQDTPDHTPV